MFATIKVEEELGTIVWANGADLSPQFLRDRLLVPAEPPPAEAAPVACDKPRTGN